MSNGYLSHRIHVLAFTFIIVSLLFSNETQSVLIRHSVFFYKRNIVSRFGTLPKQHHPLFRMDELHPLIAVFQEQTPYALLQ